MYKTRAIQKLALAIDREQLSIVCDKSSVSYRLWAANVVTLTSD